MCVYARMCVCVTENISIFKKIWPSEKNSWILYLRFKDNLSKKQLQFSARYWKKNISLLWLYNNSNFSKISKNPFVESRYKKNVPNVIIICREIGGSLESFSSFFFFSLPFTIYGFLWKQVWYSAILHPFLSTVDGTLLDISFFNLTKRMHAIFYHV